MSVLQSIAMCLTLDLVWRIPYHNAYVRIIETEFFCMSSANLYLRVEAENGRLKQEVFECRAKFLRAECSTKKVQEKMMAHDFFSSLRKETD